MSRKPRKQYSTREKMAILRERLLEGKPLSEVCDRHQLQPTVFYAWQKTFFENGAAAFERKNKRAEEGKDRQIAALQTKLANKNEVIAELMEENVRSKKSLWGTLNGGWVPHDTRDQVVDYVNHWTQRTELPAKRHAAMSAVVGEPVLRSAAVAEPALAN
jgi:transposase-like protein